MELHYINPTHTLIVAHLDAGETLGTLDGGEHGKTEYIKVDGTDANYLALLEKDPQLESVSDPGEVRMPPAAETPPPTGETGATGATGAHEGHTATQHGAAKPAAPAPAAHAAPKPAAPAAHTAPKR